MHKETDLNTVFLALATSLPLLGQINLYKDAAMINVKWWNLCKSCIDAHSHTDSMLNLSWARLTTTIRFTETPVTLSHMLFCLSSHWGKDYIRRVYHKGFNCLSEQSMFFLITHCSNTPPENSDDISHLSMLM